MLPAVPCLERSTGTTQIFTGQDEWMSEWMDVTVGKPLHGYTQFIFVILTNKSLFFRLKPWKLLKLGKQAFLTQPVTPLSV